MRTLIQVFTRRNHAATPEHNLQIIPIAHSGPCQAMVICGPGNLHRKAFLMLNLTALGSISGIPFLVALAKKHGTSNEETLYAIHAELPAVGHSFSEVCPLIRDRIAACPKMDETISDGALRGIPSVSWKEDGLSLRSDNM